jgi:UrcA family protein
MKTVLAALAAASIGMAGFAAHAEDYTLDLKKIDPATAKGRSEIKLWKTQVADAVCGPMDMIQPLDLEGVRLKCQMAVKADAQAKIDAAEARLAADRARAAISPRPAA